MRRIISQRMFSRKMPSRWREWPGLFSSQRMMAAAAMREARVPSPAPAAPISNPKMRTAFTTMLTMLTMREQNIDTLLLPIERNSADPAL